MTHQAYATFKIRRYREEDMVFENSFVARLPGLLITQFLVPCDQAGCGRLPDSIALRFDFIEDWYSVIVFLDENKIPTGHYSIAIQSPLEEIEGIWCGSDLLLRIELLLGEKYSVLGEEQFSAAVESGWMRVSTAAKARQTLRNLCAMLEESRLPQEVMDVVSG